MDPAERRELILSAARHAFASRPYEEVSLVEVAAEAQASEALVHKYFAGKAGLYAEVLRLAADDLTERTRRADDALPEGSSARDRVRTSVLTYLDFIAERSPGWGTYQALAGHDPGDFTRPERAPRRLSAQNDTCPQQPPCYRRPDLPETSGTGPDDPDRPGDDRAAALPSARGR